MNSIIIKYITLLVFACFLINTEGLSQSNNSKSEELAEVSEILSSRNYVFEPNRVLPLSGSSRALTTKYTLKVTDTIAKTHLPYFGVTHYLAKHGSNGGITFDGTMQAYSKEVNEDKGIISVKFRIHDDNNIMHICNLTVSEGGSARLHIIPGNRQSISYWGKVYKNPDDVNL